MTEIFFCWWAVDVSIHCIAIKSHLVHNQMSPHSSFSFLGPRFCDMPFLFGLVSQLYFYFPSQLCHCNICCCQVSRSALYVLPHAHSHVVRACSWSHIIWTLFKPECIFFANTLRTNYHSFERKNDLSDIHESGKILKNIKFRISCRFHTFCSVSQIVNFVSVCL